MLGNNGSSEEKMVSRYELGLVKESINQQIENSYLRGQLDFSNKLVEQGAFNASIAAQVGNLQNGFNSLTKVFVPNENVAPGWGFANVQPAPPLPPYPYPFYPPVPPTTGTASSSTNSGT